MIGYRLVCLRGRSVGNEWPLPLDRATIIGRSSADGGADVDLSPDRRVSRRHARIWLEQGGWWVEDLDSRHGTTLGSVRLPGGEPRWCEPGVPIELGATTLALFAPHWFRFSRGSLAIDLGLSPAINEAILCARGALVTRLAVSNVGGSPTAAARLIISLGAIGRGRTTIPSLLAGESQVLAVPVVDGAVDVLRGEGDCRWQPATLAVDDDEIGNAAAGFWVLPRDAWSRAPEHRTALAAFVVPSHPAVVHLAQSATAGLSADAHPGALLAAVYRHLADEWHLDYRSELPGADAISQRVRLPDQVLLDAIGKQGHGTCLDLALLIAGCLEYVGAQPLIAVVDMGTTWHALMGCWERAAPRLEPVIVDAPRLLRRTIWLDPTGCTRDQSCRATVSAAGEAAEGALRERTLVFALDVAAARGDSVRPVPVRRDPQWSAAVADAIAAARTAARAAGTRLATVPLLIGLLVQPGGLARHGVGLEDDAAAAIGRLQAGLPRGEPDARPSRHYLEVLAVARTKAELDASVLVEESHLLAALLSQPSAALDAALTSLGSDREAVQRALERLVPRSAAGTVDRSVFMGRGGRDEPAPG